MSTPINERSKITKSIFISVLSILVLVPIAVFATHSPETQHTWGNYHWARTANPMALQVIDSVTSEWQAELNLTILDWNKADALNMSITSSDNRSKTRKRCNASSGKIRVCNATYGNNGWLGLASIYIDSNGHITKGTAKMNDSYAYYWADSIQKAHVMCQEVGHLFGLGHTSEDGSSQSTCMDYSTSENSTRPNDHDIELLNEIYAHTDADDSYAAPVDPADDGGTTDPAPCRGGPKRCGSGSSADSGNSDFGRGHLIRSNEFYEEWVENHADGSKTVHHVTLVH
ncbi:MAG: hypothetical protein V7711_05750 [Pseudomonadales bacterium]